ncbi:hypothetical protein OAV76_03105 [Schleiferiaceae bacterium]|nr:hypothetical protein [Schleiferiaceae bacterium]
MRKIILLALLSFACNGQNTAPTLLENYSYTEKIIPTEDGQEFIAWIVEDDEAKRLNKVVRKLDLIEKDVEHEHLIFRTYSDGNYEYVFSLNKWKSREINFRRYTIYSIDD